MNVLALLLVVFIGKAGHSYVGETEECKTMIVSEIEWYFLS
jgi:hypothetical protein